MDKNLYTITESANELNVSRLTIYKKIDELKDDLKPYIKIKNNTKYLNNKALEIIKSNIKRPNKSKNNEKEILLQNQIEQLKKQNKILQEQIVVKDNQLQNKDDIIKNFQVLLKNEQENNIKILENNNKLLESSKKDSFFNKIFKKK
jgi:hypothetical protein